MMADHAIALRSAGFLMPMPAIWNRERIPEPALWQMNRAWKTVWFPARTVRIRAVRNVFVAQEGLVLARDLTVEPSTVRQHGETQIAQARAAVQAAMASGAVPRLAGDIVLCRRPGSTNYGHWLLEMLPQAYIAARHWPRPARYMVQAQSGPMAFVIRDGLARLGISGGLCVEAGHEPVFCENLVLVEGLTDHGSYLSPLIFECLDRIAGAVPAGADAGLLISRGAATRALIDEDEIGRRAGAQGFRTFSPGTAPFATQIAAFKGARRIVGVMGAAITNLVFAQPGTEIFMLSPANMPDTFFWFAAGLRRLHLVDVRCRQGKARAGGQQWDGTLELDEGDRHAIFSPPSAPIPFPQWHDPAVVSALFDAGFYSRAARDVLPDDADPLDHYCTVGWRRGLDPSAGFSTARYIASNADVAEAGMNPLLHYIEHGMAEGRSPVGY